MSARNCISTVTVPSPSQTSQRPPGTLKEKLPAVKPAALGVGLGGEEGADVVEGFDVCDGIGSRGAADGRLVDEDDVVEVLGAGEGAVEVGGFGLGGVGLAVEELHERAVEDLVDERGFAAAADAGDAAEQVEGDFDIDAAEVVDARAGEGEALAARLAALARDGDGQAAGQIFSGDGARVGGDFRDRAGGEAVGRRVRRRRGRGRAGGRRRG